MSLVEKALRTVQETAQRAADAGTFPASRAEPPQPGRATTKVAPEAAHAAAITVNFPALTAAGLVPPEGEERRLAQQYRQIKRPLIAAAFGRGAQRVPNGHLIMVASAMAGEGKTFTALNLSFSLAIEKDVHVLLIDADVGKPHVSRLLGLAGGPGLLEVLRDDSADPEAFIVPTDVPNLSVLPAGTPSRDATELLASTRMQTAVAALGARDPQRIVLFDSPPLLQTTESYALAQVAGQVLVVVRAEFTPQPVLLDALKILEGHPGVSLVLNQSVKSANSSYYYYGYAETGQAQTEG
ncbi:MAG: AAA family ATPase [Steroidobacteraceae bacterium]